MKPLAIDLFCGLGGWAEGFLAEGYDVIGFDIEGHPYPGQLVLQDALTLHGSQFKHAAVIVASPPCQEFSYMAMPWSRGKQIQDALESGNERFPEGYDGSRTVAQLTALFNACFRIQREASEATGRLIPMVVENVKGAQPWVGPARAHFGSFYLWGDIDSVGGSIVAGGVRFGNVLRPAKRGRKVPGMDWSKFGQPDYKPEAFNGRLERERAESIKNGRKTEGHVNKRDGFSHTRHLTNQDESERVRAGAKNGGDWFGSGENCSEQLKHGSKSTGRKVASAKIAMIPPPLARHIARAFL